MAWQLFTAIIGVVGATGVLQLSVLPGLVAAYVVAWLAGLLTPGAPAGVGVREFVLLLHRAVTLVGDFGFFGFAWLLPTPTPSAAD